MAKFPMLKILIGADDSRLRREMKRTQSTMQKFGAAVSAAMASAALAVAGFAAKLAVDGVKAAIEDAKAQTILARTLANTTGATQEQVAATEDWISKVQLARGISDTKLRGALARLTRSTKDITKAQQILNVAMDVSAGTGKDLDSVVAALGKAYDGSNTSLSRLGVGIDKESLKTMSFDDIIKSLTGSFGGLGEAAANTAEGKMARLQEAFGEMEEQVGNALLPYLQSFADWLTTDGINDIQTFLDVLTGKTIDRAGLTAEQQSFADFAEALKSMFDSFQGLQQTFKDITAGGELKTIVDLFTKLVQAGQVFQSLNPLTVLGNILGGNAPDWLASAAGATGTTTTGTPGTFGSNAGTGGVTINVNGAVDPKGTANQINRLLTRGSTYGTNPFAGKGLG